MSVELTYLVWSGALAFAYLLVQSTLFRMDYGILHAGGPRDSDPHPPSLLNRRGERALRNFLETYAMFVALAVATELSGRSDGLTQWGTAIYFWARWVYLPLYIAGVPYLRSFVWIASGIGLILLFVGVAF